MPDLRHHSTPPLNDETRRVMRAMVDRLIPPDDFAGAAEAGVDDYILRQLRGDIAGERPLVAGGLEALEAEARSVHGASFAALTSSRQDMLLEWVSRGEVRTTWAVPPVAFFARMVELTAEGFYTDPGQSGNRAEIAWKMIGYQRRVPDRPTAP
jgi:Gluconate 2-dehydrogenase subunit 3